MQRIAGLPEGGGSIPRFVVMDFRQVTGIDSSAALSFERLRRLADRKGFEVVFAGLGPMAAPLVNSGLDIGSQPFHVQSDLDAAVAWAERKLLGAERATTTALPLAELLSRYLEDPGLAEAMQAFVAPVTCSVGECFIEQGSRADDIYFIEAGRARWCSIAAAAAPLTLMSFGPGAILGEIAFYCG